MPADAIFVFLETSLKVNSDVYFKVFCIFLLVVFEHLISSVTGSRLDVFLKKKTVLKNFPKFMENTCRPVTLLKKDSGAGAFL